MWGRLGVASAGIVGALVVRAHGSDGWPWLVVNLALAWVPVGLGALAARSRAGLAVFGPLWLLFLPNAPYLLTDLVHLRDRPPVPFWFDVALLGGAGALGLALGAASLRQVANAAGRELGPRAAIALWLACPPLAGLAIYLGRFARWNSWDALSHPAGPIGDVLDLLRDPAANLQAWAFIATWTALFGAAASLAPPERPTRALGAGGQ